jgi:hypothetical protein
MDRFPRPLASFGFAMTVSLRRLRTFPLRAPFAVVALAASLSLAGCETPDNPLQGEHSVSALYKAGMDQMKDENTAPPPRFSTPSNSSIHIRSGRLGHS